MSLLHGSRDRQISALQLLESPCRERRHAVRDGRQDVGPCRLICRRRQQHRGAESESTVDEREERDASRGFELLGAAQRAGRVSPKPPHVEALNGLAGSRGVAGGLASMALAPRTPPTRN